MFENSQLNTKNIDTASYKQAIETSLRLQNSKICEEEKLTVGNFDHRKKFIKKMWQSAALVDRHSFSLLTNSNLSVHNIHFLV